MNLAGRMVSERPSADDDGVLPQSADDAWSDALVSARICMGITPAIIQADPEAEAFDPVPVGEN